MAIKARATALVSCSLAFTSCQHSSGWAAWMRPQLAGENHVHTQRNIFLTSWTAAAATLLIQIFFFPMAVWGKCDTLFFFVEAFFREAFFSSTWRNFLFYNCRRHLTFFFIAYGFMYIHFWGKKYLLFDSGILSGSQHALHFTSLQSCR